MQRKNVAFESNETGFPNSVMLWCFDHVSPGATGWSGRMADTCEPPPMNWPPGAPENSVAPVEVSIRPSEVRRKVEVGRSSDRVWPFASTDAWSKRISMVAVPFPSTEATCQVRAADIRAWSGIDWAPKLIVRFSSIVMCHETCCPVE